MTGHRHFPVFDTIPDDSFVSNWFAHIKATGQPETFDYVTTQKPADMTGVRVLSDVIEVSTKLRAEADLVPCPLCCPNSPKFARGRMVYFPGDKTVQFIGHKCAHRHMGDDYQQADLLFRKQRAAVNVQRQWPVMQGRREELAGLVGRMLPVAKALETTRSEFDRETRDSTKGQSDQPTPDLSRFLFSEIVNYGGILPLDGFTAGHNGNRSVRGYEILGPGCHPVSKLKRAAETLADLALPLPEWDGRSEDLALINEIISRGRSVTDLVPSLNETLMFILDARRFWDAENLSLIEAWGKSGFPFASMEFRRRGRMVFLKALNFQGSYSAAFAISEDLSADLPGIEEADLIQLAKENDI